MVVLLETAGCAELRRWRVLAAGSVGALCSRSLVVLGFPQRDGQVGPTFVVHRFAHLTPYTNSFVKNSVFFNSPLHRMLYNHANKINLV